MRLNKFLASQTLLSRRAADDVIAAGKVILNETIAKLGTQLHEGDKVTYHNKSYTYLQTSVKTENYTVLILNKPVGYVCSRDGQGSKTIFDLLPKKLHHLQPAGRLDKDSSGLLIMTSNGDLLYRLTHPSFKKQKVYQISLNKPLKTKDLEAINKTGVRIGDRRLSRFDLEQLNKVKVEKLESKTVNLKNWTATLEEGRNRQIRRTFEAVGYEVLALHRTKFDAYKLDSHLKSGKFEIIS